MITSSVLTVDSRRNDGVTTNHCCFRTSKTITYYTTLQHVATGQIRSVAFNFCYDIEEFPISIEELLKSQMLNYEDKELAGSWRPVGPVVVWNESLGYTVFPVRDLYKTVNIEL